jgi:hypothetical protein
VHRRALHRHSKFRRELPVVGARESLKAKSLLQFQQVFTTRFLTHEAFLQSELAELRHRDVLSQVRIATLQSQVAAYARTGAVVVWDTSKKSGLIQFSELPVPQPGKN